MKSETFKKALKERISGMIKDEVESKLDAFVDAVCETDIHDPDYPDTAVTFEVKHEFSPDVLKFIQQMLG